MSTYKLRVKLGAHEFEAEGPVEAVKKQFESWQKLIASITATAPATATLQGTASSTIPVSRVTEIRTPAGYAGPLDVFNVDDKRKIVTLQAHPTGENKEADAGLLILYGYKEIEKRDDVPVTKLKESLAVSGLRPNRIDRALAPHSRAGFILKAGRGKGGKYRLTNTGYAKAQQMVYELFEKMAR